MSTPLSTLTLTPPDGITVANSGVAKDGTAVPDAKPTRFALFVADWIEMQHFVTGAMRLAVSTGDFTTKYGTFDTADETDITNCVKAFKALNDAAAEFGNPATLNAEMQALGAGDEPDSLYGRIVWVSTRIANAADTFHSTYSALKEVLGDDMALEDRKAALQDILTGPGGLSELAADMQAKALALQQQLLAFSAKIDAADRLVDQYAADNSKIATDAKAAQTDDAATVQATTDAIHDLQKKYADYCAAAAAGSIGIMILTGGMAWPLAVADAAVFGTLAEKARKTKDDLEDLIGSQRAELAQKTLLCLDLAALNTTIGPIKASVDKTADLLGAIAGVWANEVQKFKAITDETNLEQLASYSALVDRLHILDAQRKWQQIALDTFQFTAGAFVTIR